MSIKQKLCRVKELPTSLPAFLTISLSIKYILGNCYPICMQFMAGQTPTLSILDWHRKYQNNSTCQSSTANLKNKCIIPKPQVKIFRRIRQFKPCFQTKQVLGCDQPNPLRFWLVHRHALGNILLSLRSRKTRDKILCLDKLCCEVRPILLIPLRDAFAI